MTMSVNEKIHVFLFEDDPLDVDLIRLYLGRQKNIRFDVDVSDRLSTGIKQLALKRYDVILSDLGLPDSSGLDTFMKVHAALPDIPIIVLTGLDDEEIALRAVNQGAQDYLVKGEITTELLLKAIRYAIERQKISTELKGKIIEIEKLERERENMLSMFAHDIKNVLVPAVGFVDRILSGKTDKMQDRLEQTLDALLMIDQMTTSFLDYARMKARGYKPVTAPSDPDALIRRQIDLAMVVAEQKNIMIRYKPCESMPTLDVDSVMINRVVTNLLNNAVKYSGEGGLVEVQTLETDRNLRIEIRDSGQGIAADKIPFLFDAFYRVSRDQKGSGLGLTIAKSIVEAHGGQMWVDSTPGEGSIFGFSLPKYASSEAAGKFHSP
jgi:signal transduction histidine kinase